MTYKVVPISSAVAEQVRKTMTSPFGGLPAFTSVATGYGPCRTCLNMFRQGEEERIFITYDPFNGISDLPLPGPVFIHSDECEEYASGKFPEQLLPIPLILEGFGDQSRLVRSEPFDVARVNEQITQILETPQVKFINIRNAEAGCFVARIEPSP